MTYRSDWSFKEINAAGSSVWQPKKKTQTVKNKKKKRNKTKGHSFHVTPSKSFYSSPEWLALRYRVLKKYGSVCMLCGATRDDGVKMHVDHIKPRSKFPKLALEFSNMQILCEHCNIGKSNKDETDWRPDETAHEIAIVAAAMERI